MTRHGSAGKPNEFTAGIGIRYDGGGGDNAKHFHGAVEGLIQWRRYLKRCSFVSMDCFAFLEKVRDLTGNAIYADAPWVDAGLKYRHFFRENDHRRLALKLSSFKKARVVVRYGDHPLIRDLYPAPRWRIIEQTSRKQSNADCDELLMINDGGANGRTHISGEE